MVSGKMTLSTIKMQMLFFVLPARSSLVKRTKTKAIATTRGEAVCAENVLTSAYAPRARVVEG